MLPHVQDVVVLSKMVTGQVEISVTAAKAGLVHPMFATLMSKSLKELWPYEKYMNGTAEYVKSNGAFTIVVSTE